MYGRNPEEHDKNLYAVFSRLQEMDARLSLCGHTFNADDYVNYVCWNVIPKAMTFKVKVETKEDMTLQALAQAIEEEDWSDYWVQAYRNVK